mgnify:CR=1 FL=1
MGEGGPAIERPYRDWFAGFDDEKPSRSEKTGRTRDDLRYVGTFTRSCV